MQRRDTEQRPCEAGRKDWNYVAPSHGTPGAPEIGTGKERFSLEFPRRHSSDNILISDF
jgi:hypothetical protein